MNLKKPQLIITSLLGAFLVACGGSGENGGNSLAKTDEAVNTANYDTTVGKELSKKHEEIEEGWYVFKESLNFGTNTKPTPEDLSKTAEVYTNVSSSYKMYLSCKLVAKSVPSLASFELKANRPYFLRPLYEARDVGRDSNGNRLVWYKYSFSLSDIEGKNVLEFACYESYNNPYGLSIRQTQYLESLFVELFPKAKKMKEAPTQRN